MQQNTFRTLRNIALMFVLGLMVAHTVLGNNIELIQQQVPLSSLDIGIDGAEVTAEVLQQSIESAFLFLYVTFGAFAASGLLFVFLVYRVVYHHRLEDRNEGLMIVMDSIRMLLYAVMGLMIFGYCLQLALIDPIQGAPHIFGQPYGFDFSLEGIQSLKAPLTNPFTNPTVALLLASGLMLALSKTAVFPWLNQQLSEYQQKQQAKALVPQSLEDSRQEINLRLYQWLFLITLVVFLMLLLLPSAFFGGITFIEVPKVFLVISMAGYITELARVRLKTIQDHVAASKLLKFIKPLVNLVSLLPLIPKPQWTTQREYEAVQATKVLGLGVAVLVASGGLFYALNDLGATLIVLFAFVLINAATALKNILWQVGLLFYGVLFAIQRFGATRIQVSEERINDWLLSDHFVASGIGEDYLPGTVSSPDFAKALWGVASGGWFGRWTGLFVDSLQDVYTASVAFAYNDRALAGILEVFGVAGLLLVILFYGIMVNACLVLSLIPQRSNISGFGVSLGLAALIFGQTAVHMGGNLGFIPFTGIVLPFISHSGLATLVALLVIAIMLVLYSPSITRLSLTPPKRSAQERLKGMQNFMAITYIIVLFAGMKQTLWDGPANATRVRYDVQSDLNVKQRLNPRYYLLTHQMSAQGQIQDSNGEVIRDREGQYPLKHLDQRDVFLHRFEEAHRFSLKGLNTQAISGKRYFEKVCVLKDGEYHQFAGATIQASQAQVQQLKSTLSEASEFDCTVIRGRSGELIQRRVVGVPVDPYDATQGCAVDGDPLQTSASREVSYFAVSEENKLQKWLLDTTKKRPQPLTSSEMRGRVFGLFGRTAATACLVTDYRTSVESRQGVSDGEECVVTDVFDDSSVTYGENEINGASLGEYSARAISIVHDNGTCTAQIERIACHVDGVDWVDQHAPDEEAALASIEVLYGTNRRLTLDDTTCRVVFEEFGSLKQHPSSDAKVPRYQFRERPVKQLVTGFEGVLDLADYVRVSTAEQHAAMTELSERVPEVVATMGLDATLQSALRGILDAYQTSYDAASVQAIVFRVDSGEILAQAQSTAVRSDLQQAAANEDYGQLYTDFGMYGFARNNLSSYMVPASTFKIYHAMAAIDAGHADFTHRCDTTVGYLPKDATWDPPKPIEDYGANSVGYTSHNNTSKGTTMAHAIYKSCNQYFAALADEHTHPQALTELCSEKGIRFSANDACVLKPAGTRGAASNGYGQDLTMNVYQLANMLISASTNYQPYLEDWDAYIEPSERLTMKASAYQPLFLEGDKVEHLGSDLLAGMQTKAQLLTNRLNKDASKTPVRVYGKTGTGDHLISTRTHNTEKVGTYIVPRTRRGKQVWEENYEAPYGVNAKRRKGVLQGSNMSIYVALVEHKNHKPNQIHGQRIGIVVRVPRVNQKPSGCRYGVTASCVAEPIAEDIISLVRDHGLITE